jgi:hypothetical protein
MQCRGILLQMAEEKRDQRRQSSACETQNSANDEETKVFSLAQNVEQLVISTAAGDVERREVLIESQSPSPRHRQSTIICDAWYGLPTQKRPRKERVNAVARQLRNFEQSALLSSKLKGGVHVSTCTTTTTTTSSNQQGREIRVVLVGKKVDVHEIGDRLKKLREEDEGKNKEISNISTCRSEACRVELLPNVSVEEAACGRRRKVAREDDADCALYLSPDAETTLDPSEPPPRTVVVGMLIDRRVQPNRSSERAEKIAVSAARLPMDELKVEGLETNEALNVDTVLEMMVCWWDRVDDLAGCEGGGKEDGISLRRCFVTAASAAMVSHEDRHPNRAIHGTGS